MSIERRGPLTHFDSCWRSRMRFPAPPRPIRFLTAAFAVACCSAAPSIIMAEEARHPFSVRDMVAMERLAGPQPSPDGRQGVFTRRVYDSVANKNSTSPWVVGFDGG